MEPNQIIFSALDFSSRDEVSIKGKIAINSSKKKLWNVITTPGYLTNVHPFCKEHNPVKWDSVGCKDEAFFYSGKVMNREIIELEAERFYKVQVAGNKVNKSTVLFEIESKNENTCTFSVYIKSEAFKNTPRPLWNLYAKKKIEKNLKEYLSSLLNGIKYYSETGEPVKKNQFGNHKRFSP